MTTDDKKAKVLDVTTLVIKACIGLRIGHGENHFIKNRPFKIDK